MNDYGYRPNTSKNISTHFFKIIMKKNANKCFVELKTSYYNDLAAIVKTLIN